MYARGPCHLKYSSKFQTWESTCTIEKWRKKVQPECEIKIKGCKRLNLTIENRMPVYFLCAHPMIRCNIQYSLFQTQGGQRNWWIFIVARDHPQVGQTLQRRRRSRVTRGFLGGEQQRRWRTRFSRHYGYGSAPTVWDVVLRGRPAEFHQRYRHSTCCTEGS